ncbi:MAG TPA: energy transducer TonB [Bryobacteraceae bacterium]|jgi:hypothetical protein|nr:energy transducer TonB [Bryobacteraceae bacterium]
MTILFSFMKILRVLLVALCLSSCLSAQDKTQPPVLVTKVEPDYRNLTAGYFVDIAEVEMTLDAAGVPFALKSSVGLPDNVVQALSAWRYQPYKKNGHAVPCALTMNVPIRRQITPLLEGAIQPGWFPTDEQVRQAVEEGNQLTAETASKLAEDLPSAEAVNHARTSLLIYYTKGLPDVSKAREARAGLIAWLIQNYPEDEILGSPAGIINASGEPLADAEAQNRAKQLWLQAVKASPINRAVAEHAVNFLRIADPEKALEILAGMRTWLRASAWIGNVYGLRAMAVSALDPRDGSAVAVDDAVLRSNTAQSAQTALLNATDAKVVLSAMATVEGAHAALSQTHLWMPEHRDFCQRLLNHTKELYPATHASCDAVERNLDLVPLIHTPQKLTQAKLKKKVVPPYPAEAKYRRIQGTLDFSAIISETGRIEELGLLSGPLAFYPSTQHAVSQWEYVPTMRNGRPVAVATEITVHFDIR